MDSHRFCRVMELESSLPGLMVKAKSKLEKLNHRESLLKRTLLRVSYNSWRIQWNKSHGNGWSRRRFPRKDRDSKNNQGSNEKKLYDPELLRFGVHRQESNRCSLIWQTCTVTITPPTHLTDANNRSDNCFSGGLMYSIE
ncbi:hypothetical protein ACTXT7_009162 [Hymenolepis weldensis]